jgi:hypothetical protein
MSIPDSAGDECSGKFAEKLRLVPLIRFHQARIELPCFVCFSQLDQTTDAVADQAGRSVMFRRNGAEDFQNRVVPSGSE